MGKTGEALLLFEEALEMRRRLFPGDHPDVATSLNNLSYLLSSVGRASEARLLLEKALKMRRRLFPGDHPAVASSLNNLAGVLRALGRAGDALPLHKEALAMVRRIFAEDHPHVAASLSNLASALSSLGAAREALPFHEEALEMYRRLFKGDHPQVATALNNLASVLESLGKYSDALPMYSEALDMSRRLFEGDHPDVASGLNGLASVLFSLGRADEALPLHDEALQTRRRLFKGDHPDVAASLNNLASVLHALGKAEEALRLYNEALGMSRRLFTEDHPHVAAGLNNIAYVLESLGKHREALSLYEEALEMRRRLFHGDHRDVATSLNNMAYALSSLGKYSEALSLYEEAFEMRRRLFTEDHPDVATSLNNLAHVLLSLGRTSEARQHYEVALEIYRRLFTGDHPDVAKGLSGLAGVLFSLGRASDALPLFEEALEMYRRLFKGDHPAVAASLNNLGLALHSVGKDVEALPLHEEALGVVRRLFKGDHPAVATSLSNLGLVLHSLGKDSDALPLFEEAMDMQKRVSKGDHPHVARALTNLACLLAALDRNEGAEEKAEEAIQIGQRIRWPDTYVPRVLLGALHIQKRDFARALQVLMSAARQLEEHRKEAVSLGSEGRAQYMALLRDWDPYPLMVRAHVARGRAGLALDALERSRGREMLDLLQQSTEDPLEVAKASAARRGDEKLVDRIEKAAASLDKATAGVAIAVSAVKRAQTSGLRQPIKAAKRVETEARIAHDRALRERLFVIRRALPEGRPLDSAQARALLAEGERMLAYSLGERSFVLVVSKGGVAAHALGTAQQPVTSKRLANAVRTYRNSLEEGGATPEGAAPHPGKALFEMLMPDAAWQEVRTASRVYVLPHGVLHQLPFEALVVRSEKDEPVYWAHEGPPIAYAASAAVLAALRARPRASGKPLVVAVGDPVFDAAVPWPAKGVVVKDIAPASQAAKAQLRPGDVITSYGGKDTATYEDLIASIGSTDRQAKEVTLAFEREGARRTIMLQPGRIGVFLAKEPPPVAGPKVLSRARPGVLRSGRLARLPGTGNEVRAIQSLLERPGSDVTVTTLLREQATEAALFEATTSPRILHLATHGLIERKQGARASRLALTRPRVPVPGNDGFLSLGDLLDRWRSRLEGTELVVLSACESHAGRLDQDEGMLALPWGFCFAGARSCIAGLWKVDDASTAKLMTSLYRRMFEGDTLSPCEALHAARKELMTTHPDPHHWAPFLFAGAP